MADDQGNEQEGLTAEEAASARSEMVEEVFGSAGTSDDDSQGTSSDEGHRPEPTEAKPKEKDPWEGVPKVIRDQFEAMEEKVASVGTVTERLQQAEKRIGALTNELSTKAKKDAEDLAAKEKAAPTQEQIDAAAQSESEWEDLKEEFPVWAKVIDDRFKKEAETYKTLEGKIEKLSNSGGGEAVDGKIDELKMMIISVKHGDWQEVKETKEFQEFAGSKPEYATLRDSRNPLDSIKLLDAYKDTQKPSTGKKTNAQIAEERKKRLKQSTTPSTGSPKSKPLSDEDIDPQEFRQREGAKIYSEA